MLTLDAMKRIAVVGSGTMGNGIAHVFAQAGFEVWLIDTNQTALDRGLMTIGANLDRQVKKEIISLADREATLSRITTTLDLTAVKKCHLVVEAISEDLAAKTKLFRDTDAICEDDTILATNTSSLSITQLAGVTKRADRVIGMHFMNPVPVMKLVEVIRGLATSDATYAVIRDLCGTLGKTAVEVNDYPGFVSNRILMPMINEAIYAVMEGVAKPEDIDAVMKLGMNHPMGPLALADFIGLDVCLAIMEVLYTGYADSKYRPCPLLRKMALAGYLGRKTGRGFYVYETK